MTKMNWNRPDLHTPPAKRTNSVENQRAANAQRRRESEARRKRFDKRFATQRRIERDEQNDREWAEAEHAAELHDIAREEADA